MIHNLVDKPTYKNMALEELEVYQIALEISDLAWDIYQTLSKEFRFSTNQQFLDAADSVGATLWNMKKMEYFYVYVLKSKVDGNFYTGYTSNLDKRLKQHNNGEVKSTEYRKPLDLIYFEASCNEKDALHREKYLKTSYGKRYIRNRVKNYLG